MFPVAGVPAHPALRPFGGADRRNTAGAVPVWNAVNGNWEPSNAVQALQTELEALKSRVAALEAAAEEPPSA